MALKFHTRYETGDLYVEVHENNVIIYEENTALENTTFILNEQEIDNLIEFLNYAKTQIK